MYFLKKIIISFTEVFWQQFYQQNPVKITVEHYFYIVYAYI